MVLPTNVTNSNRPLIGITSRLDPAANNLYLRRYYSEAVAAAGGAPVLIPLIPDREYLTALAGRLDGLLLSGSDSDVDPVRYGEEPHQKLGPVYRERDETDLLMLELAEELRLPVLAICFGIQSLNVSRGGTLIQDIGSQVSGAIKHERVFSHTDFSHSISIESDSVLAQLAGGNSGYVNSSHHQAIKDVGNNLRVIAWAIDGVTEAVVDTRPDRYVLGVQWHPEVGWERDKLSQAIFASFVETARNK
ncbi:MAG TPA: gamma-glutamyl-gamma-aminobutyrate hydrolase family protein [Blastocatellia bacterium]|nr:gamma-glutamyl-gamma-aminobutyrate hydrolase family protein [Blastocatellia bacterium]